MTNEEAINMLHGIRADNLNLDDVYTKDKYEALGMAIKALEQQPCEDAISRKAVLEWIKGSLEQYANTYSNDMLNMWMLFEEQIKAMSPIQPKTKVGKWIKYDYRTVCPREHDVDNPYWRIPENRMNTLKYCPYCGGKIEVEK